MGIVGWSDSFCIGIETFDEHHQGLVSMLNSAFDAVKLNNKFAVHGIVEDLTRYAVYHFTAEEEMMRSLAFPGLDAHLQEHEYFASQVQSFNNAVIDEEPLYKITIVTFLREWLIEHILKADKEFADYLAAAEHPE